MTGGGRFRQGKSWAALMHALRWLGPALPKSVFSHLWFNGPFTVSIAGVRFRMRHCGAQIENELFWRGAFLDERTLTSVMAGRMAGADVFLDVGANSGFYSLLAASLNPASVIIAFEPSDANFKVLSANIAMNGLPIQSFEAAVTSEDGPVVLYDFDEFSYSASLVQGFRPGTVARTVPGLSLDSFAEQHGLWGKRLLLKIDVEGHEEAVLIGAARLKNENVSLIVEMLTADAIHSVSTLLPPDGFSYRHVDERLGKLVEVTALLAANAPVPVGNYLIEPAHRGARP